MSSLQDNYSTFKVHNYNCWYCGNVLDLARIQNENFGSYECKKHKKCTLTYAATVDKMLLPRLHGAYLDLENSTWVSLFSNYKQFPFLYLEDSKLELNDSFLNLSIDDMVSKIDLILLYK